MNLEQAARQEMVDHGFDPAFPPDAVQQAEAITRSQVYPATVRNRARLAYSAVGPWLEGSGSLAAADDVQAQLRLQNEAAHALRQARDRLGALTFDRKEVQPVMDNGSVRDIVTRANNRAGKLIEDFMIAANQVMAETL